MVVCFFFKQKTAYEMRISDWSSDVCSSDLQDENRLSRRVHGAGLDCRWQGRFFALIVADRHFPDGFDCRVFWGPSSPCLSLDGGHATIALDIHLEVGGVMNETVEGRERSVGVRDTTCGRPAGMDKVCQRREC